MTTTDFTGGVAVITGAGSGIGAGLAREAASRGMRVVLADVNLDAIEALSAELNAAGAETIARKVDVSDPAALDSLAALAYDTWGQVDLLVNNAGIEVHGLMWEIPVDLWNSVISVNLNGVANGMRSFIPRMLESGRRSHIVNLASVAALGTRTHTSPYGATKHAVLALTEIVAKELAPISSEVVMSAVLPGAVDTSIFVNAISVDDGGPGDLDRTAMRERLASEGIDPREAARIIFAGASKGMLRIHTDLEMSGTLIATRAEELRSSLVPAKG